METGVFRRDLPEVEEYGCVRCQKWHVRGIDPEYDAHIFDQSKHGPRTRRATPGEAAELRKRRVG